MAEVASRENNYEAITMANPNYKHIQLQESNGTRTAQIPVGAGAYSEFELQVGVYNLSKSYLSFVATIPQVHDGTNPRALVIPADALSFVDSIQLQTLGGLNLCQALKVPHISKVTRRYNTSVMDYLVEETPAHNGSYNSQLGRVSMEDTSPLRVIKGPTSTGGGAGTVTLRVRIPLSAFIHTILEQDKDIPFNVSMKLRVTWANAGQIYYSVQADDDSDPQAAANPIGVTELNLHVASEQNKEITNAIWAAVASGEFNMFTEYISYEERVLDGGVKTFQSRHTADKGPRLIRVYNIYARPIANGPTILDISAGVAPGTPDGIQTYQTSIDDTNLQNFVVDLRREHDYMFLKDKLKGSVVQSLAEYRYAWAHVDDFGVSDRFTERDSGYFNIQQGEPLVDEMGQPKVLIHTWQILSCADQQDYLIKAAVHQRVLTVNPNGIFIT